MNKSKEQLKKLKPYLFGRLKITPENETKRFFIKIRKTEGCWFWTGTKTLSGYGQFDILPYGKKKVYSHRYSYKYHYGNFNESLFVCHKCDNPSCVKPDHLFLGTAKDNSIDCFYKGRGNLNLAIYQRSKTHCKKGHEYTQENTAIYKKDYRSCKQCNRDKSNKVYHKKRSLKFSENTKI